MQREELQRTLPVSAKNLWNAWFNDAEFQAGIDKVMIIATEVKERTDSGSWPALRIERTRVFETDRDIPKVLLKLVKGMTRVTEVSVLDTTAGTMSTRLTIPVIGKRTDYGYIYRWKPSEAEGDSVDLRWEGHCNVSLPVVGGMTEKYLMGELLQATVDGAAFVSDWFGREGE